MDKATGLKITVSLVLFIAYVCTFGQKSIRRYLDKDVIITEHEEIFELSSMQPPGKKSKYLCLYFFII